MSMRSLKPAPPKFQSIDLELPERKKPRKRKKTKKKPTKEAPPIPLATSGTIFIDNNGNLCYRGPSGTVTTIAPG